MRRKWIMRSVVLAIFVLSAVVLISRPYLFRSLQRSLSLLVPSTPQYPPAPTPPGKCLHTYDIDNNPDYQSLLDTYNRLDSSGVPVHYYSGYDFAAWQYTPYVVASYGINALNAWCINHDTQGLQIAIRQADWLVANADTSRGFATWHYDFPNPLFQASPGWTSSFGDAFPMVFLTQMNALMHDSRYQETAAAAVGAFAARVEDGGVQGLMPDGQHQWFEEVADPNAPQAHILNGDLLATEALAYYAEQTSNSRALQLANTGIASAIAYAHAYDGDNHTLYDLLIPNDWRQPNEYAHIIQARLMLWIYGRTGDETAKYYGERWTKMTNNLEQADYSRN